MDKKESGDMLAEVKWIKITTNMFDDEKIKLIDAMPERDTVHYIWIRLLVQAGKTNANGYIFLNDNVPYTEEMLSTIFNRPLNSLRFALKVLRDFGMIQIQEDKLIKIANWSKHQNIEGMEKVRQQTRERVAKHRAKKKELLEETKRQSCKNNDNKKNIMLHETLSNGRDIDIEDIDIEIKEDRKSDIRKNLDKINEAYFNTFYRQISATYLNQVLKVMAKEDYTDLLIYALDITKKREQEQGKIKGFKYTMSILESWINKGYKSPQDVKKNEISKKWREGEVYETSRRNFGENLKKQGIGL
ncbi:phage replisome organizer N-terminal domain-containing protein [Clostridium botulinum]|uniref:phage replisome organizer N-terminal domain-containing protein n=1 Tax=Clostridium botulinum TaxID=1491 RepID=UPI0005861B52|nr:phage replisome organizer N-terminal domain-containing protein [Clostridium botulinum]AJD27677.1 replication initiation and membrane attachment family protein [Clostridium botulinum CDC_297]APQ99891.1 replication initiation and membrane attachment family protein [Clostridium botulinum]MBY6876516.1 phage replisome organizer N-terminal domain-containing protein [Clostridium botulinum]MBY6891806.1 phage replisome organizer N-terminal domain-containing protein [Clostridium botulinum]MBY6895936.